MRRAILVAMLVMAGCGAQPQPDYWIDGVGVKVEPGAPDWTRDPDLSDRVLATIDAGAAYWGGHNHSDLQGWVVVLRASLLIDCDGSPGYFGCTHGDDQWIDLAAAKTNGIEGTDLVHEVGHVVLERRTGDPDACHQDPRWRDLEPVEEALRRLGFDAHASIWRATSCR